MATTTTESVPYCPYPYSTEHDLIKRLESSWREHHSYFSERARVAAGSKARTQAAKGTKTIRVPRFRAGRLQRRQRQPKNRKRCDDDKEQRAVVREGRTVWQLRTGVQSALRTQSVLSSALRRSFYFCAKVYICTPTAPVR
eukprot:scaffold261420_cov28-Tisochrysis_lutea.AAC.1